MRLASTFLNCRVGGIPFQYLGLLVGANPRCMSTWEPMLESLRKRLQFDVNWFANEVTRKMGK
ncbi:non-LTR retroelement reverse transcriptase-like related, partial [Trifolium medium]|nr:non-LTR retroelement reverse transcriptase-like related [Trifolium medium]